MCVCVCVCVPYLKSLLKFIYECIIIASAVYIRCRKLRCPREKDFIIMQHLHDERTYIRVCVYWAAKFNSCKFVVIYELFPDNSPIYAYIV